MLTLSVRPLYKILGFISLALGLVGVVVPIMPTTPFAILAAYLFSKSSPAMEAYVLNLKVIGPLVRSWREDRVISPKAKVSCTVMIVLVMGISLYTVHTTFMIKLVMALIGLAVIIFVTTRKSSK